MIYFNNKIKEARLENNLTQKQLAQKLTELGHKTSNTAIANWESGLNKPDIDTLEAICIILNKDGNYFFDELISIASEKDNITNYQELIQYYQKLNDRGKKKAIENVKNLTYVPEYIEKKIESQEA